MLELTHQRIGQVTDLIEPFLLRVKFYVETSFMESALRKISNNSQQSIV